MNFLLSFMTTYCINFFVKYLFSSIYIREAISLRNRDLEEVFPTHIGILLNARLCLRVALQITLPYRSRMYFRDLVCKPEPEFAFYFILNFILQWKFSAEAAPSFRI